MHGNTIGPMTVFGSDGCRKCKALSEFLNMVNVEHDERDVNDADVKTALAMDGRFDVSLPILKVGRLYVGADELFPHGQFDERRVRQLVGAAPCPAE